MQPLWYASLRRGTHLCAVPSCVPQCGPQLLGSLWLVCQHYNGRWFDRMDRH